MAVVPEIVFVLGPPGAGKGTQCSKIKDQFGYIHLSAGDLLRDEQAAGSPDGDLIADFIKNGKIVPIEITIRLLEKAIVSRGATKVLIDGFPRDKANLEGWEREMVDTGKMKTKFMLFFDCEEDECLKRAMGRNQNRSDDNIESFKKRIRTYLSSTMVVVNEFDSRGLLKKVNANGSPDEVFEETQKLFLLQGDTPIFTPPLPTHTDATTFSSPLPVPQPLKIQPLEDISAPRLPTLAPHPAEGPTDGSVVIALGDADKPSEEYSGIFTLCQIL